MKRLGLTLNRLSRPPEEQNLLAEKGYYITIIQESIMLERLNVIAEEICRKYGATYVLLFGSRATSKIKPYSDVDLAVKLAGLPGVPMKTMSEIKWFAEESLEGEADVDVVVLNGLADSILKYEIYVSGRPLCVKDPVEYFDDKVNAIDEYLDYEPHFKSFFERALGELNAIARRESED